MKRFLITLLISIICVPIALGVVLYISHRNINEEDNLPKLTLQWEGGELQPYSYEWFVPVFSGLMDKEFSKTGSGQPQDLGLLNAGALPLVFPEGYQTTVTFSQDGTEIWSGTPEAWNTYSITKNGSYNLEVVCLRTRTTGNAPYGKFIFKLSFALNVQPVLETGPTLLTQGDVLALRLSYLQDGATPQVVSAPSGDTGSSLDVTPFIHTGPGQMTAYVPTYYRTQEGEYSISVECSGYSWDINVTVQWVNHPKANVSINDDNQTLVQAGSKAAAEEYEDMIRSLAETFDSEQHWDGLFLTPATGNQTTEYATRMYDQDGNLVRTFYPGVDIAAPEGTGVVASGAGRVVFASALASTGNTIVIDHGGGLHTVYGHLASINVQVSDDVSRGHVIGAVGSTGYSMTPHLQYGVYIGDVSINPALVLGGNSGLYYFE